MAMSRRHCLQRSGVTTIQSCCGVRGSSGRDPHLLREGAKDAHAQVGSVLPPHDGGHLVLPCSHAPAVCINDCPVLHIHLRRAPDGLQDSPALRNSTLLKGIQLAHTRANDKTSNRGAHEWEGRGTSSSTSLAQAKQYMEQSTAQRNASVQSSMEGADCVDLLQVAAFDETVGCLRQEEAADEEDDAGDGGQAQRDAPPVRPQVVHADVQALCQQDASDDAQLEQHGQRASELQWQPALWPCLLARFNKIIWRDE